MMRLYQVNHQAVGAIERCICRPDGAIVGFEDVLTGPRNSEGLFGTGDVYNSRTATEQLAFALSMAEHPAIADTLYASRGAEVIHALRAAQVLKGMRILDLGCGLEANFARAAKALGATVFAADALPLDLTIAMQIDGHLRVDFTHLQAADEIARQTGGNFNIVTENMIGPVPESGDVHFPELSDLLYIANATLAEGGIFYAGVKGAAQYYMPVLP